MSLKQIYDDIIQKKQNRWQVQWATYNKEEKDSFEDVEGSIIVLEDLNYRAIEKTLLAEEQLRIEDFAYIEIKDSDTIDVIDEASDVIFLRLRRIKT